MATAKVCIPGNVCATVYGDTAKIVNAIAVGAALVVAIALIMRALK